MNLPIADYSIIYNQKDITSDISDKIISVEYTDKIAGQSDELEITLEDSNQLWMNGWYPQKGDTLQCIIRLGSQQLNCGTFEIDELGSNGSTSGYVFTIKALGTGISKKFRTKNSYAHANKTLAQIANTVAANLGLTVLGNIENILLSRMHQYRETDLQFLNRIGNSYGYMFSVRADKLVFVHYSDIENKQPVVSFGKQDLISWNIKDTTHKTFKKSRVRHHDPVNKALIEDSEDETNTDYEGEGNDDLEIHDRVENVTQAKHKAKYALYNKNSQGVGGDLSMPGNLSVLSGNNLSLPELGSLKGVYHILEAKHSVNRDGAYQSSCNIKRVKK